MKQLSEHRTKADKTHLLGKGLFGDPKNKKRSQHTEYNIGDAFQADLSVTKCPCTERGDIRLVVIRRFDGTFVLRPSAPDTGPSLGRLSNYKLLRHGLTF